MKKTQLYMILFGISVILASCEKIVTDVDIPKVDPQLALFGFISPEEQATKVQLTISRPVFGEKRGVYKFVTDAVVTITNDGGQSAQLFYTDSNNAYNISKWQFPIEPGRTYTITASSGKYRVKASCSVPADMVSFSDVSYQRLGGSGSDAPAFRYLYKWNDLPGRQNYYRTSIESYLYGTGGFYKQEICTQMYNDESEDGKTLGGNCEDYDYSGGQTRTVDFYLLNTDVHYYEYHKRRLNYYGEDPFSEPFPQYSNVEGGLGVFCSYRKTIRSIEIQ
jgi:hypothetical protein